MKVDSITDILLRRRAVGSDKLRQAAEDAQEAGVKLERYLVEQSVVSDVDMALALAEYLGMPPIQLAHLTVREPLMDLLPKATMSRHLMLPIAKTSRMLTVAMADPFDVVGLDEVHALTNLEVVPVIAPERQVQEFINRFTREPTQGLEDILKDVADGDIEVGTDEDEDVSLDQMMEGAEEAPVIRIVNSIMVEALRKRASDIHIEPMEKSIRLRYRIDGMLYESPSPPKTLQAAIISRIKIMSNLDIAERRTPQDGRFKVRALGKEADIRVSLLPTIHGEKTVMRILDKTALAPNLDALGMEASALSDLKEALEQPHGMILVTGPTGSGKTTTLYSGLQELNKGSSNIITVEDPVEYQLAGINQVQVNADVGLSFADGLRSILRQDPDIVMVGEIRDGETAAIGVQAALTGHLVLSTLHTNDAAGAIARLSQMGVEPFLLASSVILTQAQRLYRRLCPACKRPRELPLDTLKLHHINPDLFGDVDTFEPVGCPKCSNLGYRGRGALMEILRVDDDIRNLILREASGADLAASAVANGMMTLRDVGFMRVRDGSTSIEEIIRVTSGH